MELKKNQNKIQNNAFKSEKQTKSINISTYYPVIAKATRNFNKSQSQFMNNMQFQTVTEDYKNGKIRNNNN